MSTVHTPNPDQSSIMYIEHYLDVVENLPNNLARILSRIHEVDIQRTKIANKLDETLNQYSKNTISANEKHRLLGQFRTMLIQLQNLSDNKICLAQTMLDQIDIKSRQLDSQCRGASSTLSSVSQPHSSNTPTSTVPTATVNSFANTNGSLPTFAKATCSTNPTTSTPPPIPANNFPRADSSNGERTLPSSTNKDIGKEPTPINSNGNGGKRATRRFHGGSKKDSNQDSNGGSGDDRPSSPVSNDRTTSAPKRGGVNKRGVKKAHKTEVKRRKAYNYNRDSPTDSYTDKVEPDEPTYCLCKQVSYGEMVCCDNPNCKIEWFHFTCVSLTANPKGRWYCPNCRGERSNILRK